MLSSNLAYAHSEAHSNTASELNFGEWNNSLLEQLQSAGLTVSRVQRCAEPSANCGFEIHAKQGERHVKIVHVLQEHSAVYVRLTVEEDGKQDPLMQYSMRVCPSGELEYVVGRELATMVNRLGSFARLLQKALH